MAGRKGGGGKEWGEVLNILITFNFENYQSRNSNSLFSQFWCCSELQMGTLNTFTRKVPNCFNVISLTRHNYAIMLCYLLSVYHKSLTSKRGPWEASSSNGRKIFRGYEIVF